MILRCLDGWLQITAWQRFGIFCTVALLLTMLLWGAWLRPTQQQHKQWQQQRQQESQRYRQQLHQLRAMPTLAELQQQAEQLEAQFAAYAGRPFSLPALLDASGAELEHWHPTAHGGELSLTLDWPQFIRMMEYLSSLQPILFFPRFNLQRKEQRLHLVMELTDEN